MPSAFGHKQPFRLQPENGRPCDISRSRWAGAISRCPDAVRVGADSHAHPFDIGWRAPYAVVTAANGLVQKAKQPNQLDLRVIHRLAGFDGLFTAVDIYSPSCHRLIQKEKR